MKKVITILIIGISTISLITGCENNQKEIEEEIKSNTNEGVIKDQKVDVFELKKTSLVYENGRTTLETTVTNTSDKVEYLKEFKIKILDKDGNEIKTLTGFIGGKIEAGESKVIHSYCKEDLSNAASIEYKVLY